MDLLLLSFAVGILVGIWIGYSPNENAKKESGKGGDASVHGSGIAIGGKGGDENQKGKNGIAFVHMRKRTLH